MVTDFDLKGHLRSLEVSGQSQIGLKFKYEQFTKKTYLGPFRVCDSALNFLSYGI